MKILIIVLVVFKLFVAGCKPTLNVTETKPTQIEEKLIDYQKDEAVGAEVTLMLLEGEDISGELLLVRGNSIITCTKYSATEEELSSLKYPISNVETNIIHEVEIKGNTYPLWIGAGIGLLGGTVVYLMIKDNKEEAQESNAFDRTFGGELGTTCLVGGISALPILIGRILSTENVILSDIPSGYKFLPLKSLARYPDEEPEYLKSIK